MSNNLLQCPFCYNTDGNHAWDCPNNPININNKQCSVLKDVNVIYSDGTILLHHIRGI